MKKLLLSFAFLASLNAFAQDPVYAFYTNAPILPEVGPDINHYVLVTSASGPNQTASGANIAWNFNDLVAITQTATTTVLAGPDDVANFPGTTSVVETTTEGGNPSYYYLAGGEGTYLTGIETSQMTIAYDSPALIGYFPMDYGDSTMGNVTGTFQGQGVEGTFAGTTTTSVDAYGTLTVNEGFEGTKNVTRLKTQQNLTLSYLGFPVGTLDQTTYSYYDANLWSGPVFRSISTHIVVTGLGIDQTQSTLESYLQTTNSRGEFNIAKAAIAPNPVQDLLHISGTSEIGYVTITDAMGRTVLQSQGNDIAVSHLPAGIYHVAVSAEGKSTTLKMVKQ